MIFKKNNDGDDDEICILYTIHLLFMAVEIPVFSHRFQLFSVASLLGQPSVMSPWLGRLGRAGKNGHVLEHDPWIRVFFLGFLWRFWRFSEISVFGLNSSSHHPTSEMVICSFLKAKLGIFGRFNPIVGSNLNEACRCRPLVPLEMAAISP